MQTLVLHTLPPQKLPQGRAANEFDLTAAAHAVAQALPRAVTVGIVGQPAEVLAVLRELKPEMVFNLCEAPLGRPDLEAHMAALFEWLGVRFTGSGSQTLALCRRKDRTHAVLAAACVPVPRTGVFPCIVKPADEDGSACIHADSICENEAELRRAKARIRGPAMVEEFLPGREFCIALWGGLEPEHVSISETVYENGLRLLTYAAKWDEASADYKNSPLLYDSPIDPPLRERLIVTANAAWRAVGARGYTRLDLRLDSAGVPRVLDVNPNPEMTPDTGMHRAVHEAGWTWERFVKKQVEWASLGGEAVK